MREVFYYFNSPQFLVHSTSQTKRLETRHFAVAGEEEVSRYCCSATDDIQLRPAPSRGDQDTATEEETGDEII